MMIKNEKNRKEGNKECETLRVVSDWVANAAARNERDVMANDVVFVSKNRGIRLLSERECKRNYKFLYSRRIHLQYAKTGKTNTLAQSQSPQGAATYLM